MSDNNIFFILGILQGLLFVYFIIYLYREYKKHRQRKFTNIIKESSYLQYTFNVDINKNLQFISMQPTNYPCEEVYMSEVSSLESCSYRIIKTFHPDTVIWDVCEEIEKIASETCDTAKLIDKYVEQRRSEY